MLEEVGAPYRVDYRAFEALERPEYRAINPIGKVPALRHGDALVTEVAAICAYLAAAFPEAELMPPPGTPASADYHRWLFFGAGPAEAAITAKAFGTLPPADKRRSVGYGTFESMLDTLELAVAGKRFLAGDRFSAADVATGSQIGFGLRFGTIEPRAAFVDYWEGIAARPAYRRAAARDNAALPARE